VGIAHRRQRAREAALRSLVAWAIRVDRHDILLDEVRMLGR
jgi:hypothetical protein